MFVEDRDCQGKRRKRGREGKGGGGDVESSAINDEDESTPHIFQVVCSGCSKFKAPLRELGYEHNERVCSVCYREPYRRFFNSIEVAPFTPKYLI